MRSKLILGAVLSLASLSAFAAGTITVKLASLSNNISSYKYEIYQGKFPNQNISSNSANGVFPGMMIKLLSPLLTNVPFGGASQTSYVEFGPASGALGGSCKAVITGNTTLRVTYNDATKTCTILKS